jgi:hypothetical protein
LFKRTLDFLIKSIIELGQALLKLDGIGVDALIIGFIVVGLIQIRARINECTDGLEHTPFSNIHTGK